MVTFKKKPEEWQARLGTNALDPLKVMDLQDAIRTHKNAAIIQGKKFLLTYYKVQGKAKVYYRPADDSFVPAGHLDVKRFLEGV